MLEQHFICPFITEWTVFPHFFKQIAQSCVLYVADSGQMRVSCPPLEILPRSFTFFFLFHYVIVFQSIAIRAIIGCPRPEFRNCNFVK